MPYAEMENSTQTKLALISERARKDSKLQFTSLAHLLNKEFLKECYLGLGRDRASGIDGVSWKEYGERLDENISDLVTRLRVKRYKPQPSRRVYIPKDEHSKRPLGLPSIEDKIVQKGIAQILEAIYEQDFLNCSYGFRPNRGCHEALKMVNGTLRTGKINYVIEADISKFFDNVSHDWMVRCLQVRIKDPSFLLLARRFLKAGYIDAGEFVPTAKGTPQGGNMSPILSNIFLHYVLDVWFEKKVKLTIRGVCHLVRYADDFVCMVQYLDDAQYVERMMRERFAKFKLELHPEKTRVILFSKDAVSNKNKRYKSLPRSFDFLGFTFYWGKSRKGNLVPCHKTSAKRFRRSIKDLSTWLQCVRCTAKLKEWWPTLQAKLRGHYQYFGVSGNCRAIGQYHDVTKKLIYKWLNRRSHKMSFNWKEFNAYLEHYPIPPARIVHQWY